MENLLVSVSFGETSMYMANWIKNNWSDKYNLLYVFANTGRENEETLEFGRRCAEHFGLEIHWVEAEVQFGKRKGTRYRVVDFEIASRDGRPLEDVIKKYGIYNQGFPHCTREAKQAPIISFAKDWFGDKFKTAIGIRVDEADRISSEARKRGFVYPLIKERPMTKQKINFWWSQQPFRLNLKGYEGNCKDCWKKSDPKLFRIAKDNPEKFDWSIRMEEKYGNYTPEGRKEGNTPYTFFRGNRSAKEILEQAKNHRAIVRDDSVDTSLQLDLLGGDSCEIFSSCGD